MDLCWHVDCGILLGGVPPGWGSCCIRVTTGHQASPVGEETISAGVLWSPRNTQIEKYLSSIIDILGIVIFVDDDHLRRRVTIAYSFSTITCDAAFRHGQRRPSPGKGRERSCCAGTRIWGSHPCGGQAWIVQVQLQWGLCKAQRPQCIQTSDQSLWGSAEDFSVIKYSCSSFWRSSEGWRDLQDGCSILQPFPACPHHTLPSHHQICR